MFNLKLLLDQKPIKTLFYVCAIKFPKLNVLLYPFYMFIIYVQIYYKNKKYRMKLIPYKLMKEMIIQNVNESPIDVNNTVILNANVVRISNINHLAKLFVYNHGKIRTKIVYVIGLNINNANQLLISDTLSFNLKLDAISNGMFCKLQAINSDVKFASYVDISLINTEHDIINALTDDLLENYFIQPKILQKNDIIPISVKDYCPKYYYTHSKINEIKFIYFKCNKIRHDENFDCKSSYYCWSDKTTLKQSANTQSFLISSTKQFCFKEIDCIKSVIELDKYMIDICPYGFENYMKELECCMKPFLGNDCHHLRPTFLIKGPRGTGKARLVKSIANKFGINLCKVNPLEVQSQTYAQTLIKVRNFMLKAKASSPTIVLIENFEYFGKNYEGLYDLRIIDSFKTELENLFSNNIYPVLLVCNSNVQDISPDLSRIFLETIEIKAPTQLERCQMLKWILKEKCFKYDLDLNEVASKTNGFLFEDLKALSYYAQINASGGKKNLNDIIVLKDFENALDIMQSKYTDTLGVPKVPKVEWSDVGALNDVKSEIIRTIELPLKYPNLLKSTGLKRSGILLYGPPGTGKTLLAKAVATECGLCFLSVKGPELLNMYVGQSEQNVREVFEKARQASPCIVFFDELDSLAPNRGMSGDSGGVMDRVVSQLLAEMDGLNQTGTIFIIGATNRPDLIDPALLRPGRFDKLLYVGPCTDFESKLAVIKALTRKFKLAKDINFDEIIKTCPSTITGADFYGICSNAWMLAAKKLIEKIENGTVRNWDNLTADDVIVNKLQFIDAIKAVKPSVSTEDLLYFDKLKKQLSAQDM